MLLLKPVSIRLERKTLQLLSSRNCCLLPGPSWPVLWQGNLLYWATKFRVREQIKMEQRWKKQLYLHPHWRNLLEKNPKNPGLWTKSIIFRINRGLIKLRQTPQKLPPQWALVSNKTLESKWTPLRYRSAGSPTSTIILTIQEIQQFVKSKIRININFVRNPPFPNTVNLRLN